MLEILNRLSKKNNSNESIKDGNTQETKKCLKCLRRVASYHDKCPHCRGTEFDD